jgi:hypothetical protein
VSIADSTNTLSHAPTCAIRPLPAGRCRIVVNDLRRTIDRLRSGIDVVEIRHARRPLARLDEPARCSAALPAPATSTVPPFYAVDPVGRIRPAADESTTSLAPVTIVNFPRVTNIGTLLDVLA